MKTTRNSYKKEKRSVDTSKKGWYSSWNDLRSDKQRLMQRLTFPFPFVHHQSHVYQDESWVWPPLRLSLLHLRIGTSYLSLLLVPILEVEEIEAEALTETDQWKKNSGWSVSGLQLIDFLIFSSQSFFLTRGLGRWRGIWAVTIGFLRSSSFPVNN